MRPRGASPPRRLAPLCEPSGGWRDWRSFSEAEAHKLRPVAETFAMLDGNAFFVTRGVDGGIQEDHQSWRQYLPEAHALYEANGGDGGWAQHASFAKAATPK